MKELNDRKVEREKNKPRGKEEDEKPEQLQNYSICFMNKGSLRFEKYCLQRIMISTLSNLTIYHPHKKKYCLNTIAFTLPAVILLNFIRKCPIRISAR
jgi:hypothetical protein